MNAPEPILESPRKRRTRQLVIGGVALIVLLIAGLLLASKAGLDKALVRQQIDRFAANLQAQGKAQGRNITLTYENITIEGGFTDRHAVVHAPKMTVQPLEPAPASKPGERPETLSVTTPLLEIFPEGKSLSAMTVSLPQPVRFTSIEEPDKTLATVTSAQPLAWYYARTEYAGEEAEKIRFEAPNSFEVTYLREQRAEGEEDATPTVTPVYETLNVALENGKTDFVIQTGPAALGEGTLGFQGITITPKDQPESAVMIDRIASHWSNARNAQHLNVVQSSFSIENINADAQILPYAPISAALDVSYEGAMPANQEEQGSITSQQSAFKLKTFRLSTKDATITANADFTATPEDKLPVGAANVTITNLPFIMGELKRYRLFDARKEQMLATLLQQITGTPYAELKDVVVDVNRARGGSFKIGKSTFEELFAALLQASMSQNPNALPVPVQPSVPSIPEQKKALPPVEVPQDTRG